MLKNQRTEAVLASQIEWADSFFLRLRGLLGRTGLDEDQAFILDPATSVHMFFMRFPIDVAFLTAEFEVVGLYHSLQPWSLSGVHWNARYAVELPSGVLAKTGTELEDQLTISAVCNE